MADEQQPDDSEKEEPKPRSHVLLWSLVSAFIVVAIVAMTAADMLFSPEALNASVAADAVGK